MPLDYFTNNAGVTGLWSDDTEPTAMSDAVTVKLIDGLEMTKTANRSSWATGYLTYTIEISNYSGAEYKNVKVTDVLGLSKDGTVKIVFVDGSVTMDGTKVTDYEYNTTTNTLTIFGTAPITIQDEKTVVITFQVEKTDV